MVRMAWPKPPPLLQSLIGSMVRGDGWRVLLP